MRLLNLVAGVLCVAVVGCLPSEEESVGTSEQSLIAANRMAANRMAANRMAANRMAANRMAANGLIDSEDGREVLKYAIECAIPEGITLVATASNGTEYEFAGAIGLAPGWLQHGLTKNDQRWVSACLFSRVNAHDVSVLISMRGQSKALETTPEERAGWSQEEGAFYGQYFVSESEPIQWYACSGKNVDVAHDKLRDCANPDPEHPGLTMCGFTYTGPCDDTCASYSDRGTHYRNCAATGDDDDDDYHQVITTFVQP